MALFCIILITYCLFWLQKQIQKFTDISSLELKYSFLFIFLFFESVFSILQNFQNSVTGMSRIPEGMGISHTS